MSAGPLAGTVTAYGLASANEPLLATNWTDAIASAAVGFWSVSELLNTPGTACASRAWATGASRSKPRSIWPASATALASARTASGQRFASGSFCDGRFG